MCWNQFVSINTFTFGVFVLLLIAFNNKYSTYKLVEFSNPYSYFFTLSVISMQLIEFFLWRNLNNESVNRLISIFGLLLILIQPIASLTLLSNITLRNKLITIYSIPSLIYFINQIHKKKFITTISKTGHLKWDWGRSPKLFEIVGYIFYLFFLYFSIFYNKYYFLIFTLPLFLITYYFYYKDGSAGSIWCWSANIIMIYLLIKLLIYLPYKEKGFLC